MLTEQSFLSDFSQAEVEGFKQAVIEVFQVSQDSTIDWERLYKFCTVHYQRSVERVKSNYGVVEFGRQEDFQNLINVFVSKTTTTEEFDSALNSMLREFPKCRPLIEWHLEHFRGKLIFPALANGAIRGFGKDTNAQEVTGRWIKTRLGITKPSLEECLKGLMKEGRDVNMDMKTVMTGRTTRYGKAKTPIEKEKERKSKGKKRKLPE